MKFHKKLAVLSLSAATSFGSVMTALPTIVYAEEGALSATAVTNVEQGSTSNVVNITFQNGYKGRVTFLEQGIFRYNVDPTGTFSKYATGSGNAKIQAQPDESGTYTHPAAAIADGTDAVTITCGTTTIVLNKADGKMTVKSGDKTVMEESAPLNMNGGKAVQSIVKNEGEDYYGGGTQNGRFVHTGEEISISNTNNWTDGGVASPNPFYWSTGGYGILRNTFKPGAYNFGKTAEETVTASHDEQEYDAYFFVSGSNEKAAVAKEILQDYFKVTGNPVLLPEYAFYLGHLNCYNRDTWDNNSGGKAWTIKGSESAASGNWETKYESGMASGYIVPSGSHAESLNGTMPTVNADQFQAADAPREFSAQAVIDRYQSNDMPLGWFLPNDGYGCGYGQNGYNLSGGTAQERQESLDANLNNLKEFTQYANAHGVSTGLWTQSNLTPIASEKQQLVRDFRGEVLTGGITSLKTDVAWVGSGYSFGLNGIKTAYDIVTDEAGKRPNIVTLDGWAGTQRYGTIWTGDQYGGAWEYIRFHIPTYIGQSLAGNPNIGSDMDGIFGGAPIIATRDYQWKTFTSTMLDMDGWGSYSKGPYTHGDPYTGISRMYLKLKAQLMPYIYTSAASAANIDTGNGDTGMPMIRAMMLEDDSDYAASKKTQYQFMFGGSLLVAPLYQDTNMQANGDDVRNDIFLPGDENTTWIDYFTGKQYKGGQVLSGFDAPLWKLPLFVKAGSIIPMYEENNNPAAISKDNPDGLDKTKRIVEFYPEDETSYTLYEDDGITADTETENDSEYGLINKVTYGGAVSTTFTSSVAGGNATVKAEKSTGSYDGYDANRSTKFVVNVSKEPTGVDINGTAGTKVSSLEAFEALGENESGWFYDAAPEMNKYSEGEDFANTHIINSPKVYVKFAKTDVSKNEQVAVVKGFENNVMDSQDKLVESIPVPTINDPAESDLTSSSITATWTAVENAVSYDIDVDGMMYHSNTNSLTIGDLPFNTPYNLKVRARTAEGYSNWSEAKEIATLDDPWRNTPSPETVTWTGDIYGTHDADLAFDHIYQSGDGGFHSNGKAINETLEVDLGLVYPLDSIEYFPRDDAGNGTVTSMDISYSMDGVSWTDLDTQSWARDASTKTVDLPENALARYVRFIPRASVGSFFSASEIKINKVDGSSGFALGSNLLRPEVTDADYSNLRNYKGVENCEPFLQEYQGQVAAKYADMNHNDIYDVFDYQFTTRALEGGTTKTGDPAGSVFFIADKTDVKEGDIVTITMYGSNVANANAIGGLFQFGTDKFEAVIPGGTSGVTGTPYLGDMENLSTIRPFNDGHATVNIAFANVGDKELYSGTRPVATFKLKAKDAGTISNGEDSMLNLAQTTMVIGPNAKCISKAYAHGFTETEIPTTPDVTLTQSDVNMTITNDAYPTDDGTNVQTLTHQQSFAGLFNGGTDPVANRDFEMSWTIDPNYNAETHKAPMTLHMSLNKPAPVKEMKVYCGALTSNGSVRKASAVITYADGSTTSFSGGDYDQPSELYTFTVPADKAALNVTKVEFTAEETGRGTDTDPTNGTMTLCEIEITAKGESDVTAISAEDNQKEVNLGSIVKVNAVVTPAIAYQNFKVESSDESIAAIDCVRDGEDINWFIVGKKNGTATITVTSLKDPTKSTTYTVTVGHFVNTDELEAVVDRAEKIQNAGIVADSSTAALAEAIASANAALEAAATQDDVDGAAMTLNRVLNSLKYRTPAETNIINYDADTWGGSAIGGSSDCSSGANEGDGLGTYAATLDKNEDTYWHSNWANSVGMPQYVTYDLGKEYDLTDISFLPRVGRYNGDIFEMEVQAGNDVDNLESVGTFTFAHSTNQLNDRGWHTVTFPTVKARYVKVIAKKTGGADLDSYASMAEIKFYNATPTTVEGLDLTLLNQAVAKADKADASEFKSGDALAAFTAALENAKTVQTAPHTQKEVDDAAKALNTALLDLRLTPSAEKLAELN